MLAVPYSTVRSRVRGGQYGTELVDRGLLYCAARCSGRTGRIVKSFLVGTVQNQVQLVLSSCDAWHRASSPLTEWKDIAAANVIDLSRPPSSSVEL